MEKYLLPFPEAGRMLGFTGKSSGKTSIHKLCQQCRLTKVKLGGRSFVTRESAERLVREAEAESLRATMRGAE